MTTSPAATPTVVVHGTPSPALLQALERAGYRCEAAVDGTSVYRSRQPAGDRPTKPSDDVDRLLLTPTEAARALSIGRTKLYTLLSTGELPSVRIGSSRRIPAAAVVDLVDRLAG